MAYAYRKPFNHRCDILLWIGIHRQTYTLLNKMVDDHHVSPFTTINNINTNMSTDGILKNENDNDPTGQDLIINGMIITNFCSI